MSLWLVSFVFCVFVPLWFLFMLSLQIRDLAKRYNQRQVFAGLNVTVAEGASLAITGPNGSGKSTLIRVLCGLTRPNGGQVIVSLDGASLSPTECRPHIGLVAPDLALYHELTALENLAFFAQVRGLKPTFSDLAALLAKVGLSARGDDLVGAYSSGMRQRLKYAQALLHRPRLLFLDEPTANLDEAGSVIVAEIIAEQKQRGILVLATNEPEEVHYGDQVLVLGS